MKTLLSVEEAVQRITGPLSRLPAEAVPLDDALGRVLAADLFSDRALPAWPTATMDGFAYRAGDVGPEGIASLTLVMDVPAGAAPTRTLESGQAARIMTGAMLPPGADVVAPVEHTDQRAGLEPFAPGTLVEIRQKESPGAYVRQIGDDLTAGERVLTGGTVLRAAEIGMLAMLGHAQVDVTRRPVVAILSSGDELAQPGLPLNPGQIYDANGFALAAWVRAAGGVPIRIPPAQDTSDSVRSALTQALSHKPDLLLSSAGVSVGAYDVVRAIIEEMGTLNFWRVNVRPGKPLAFGQIAGVPLIGLPGNPVSALVTAELFVRPALAKLAGSNGMAAAIQAAISEPLQSDGRRTYLRVRLRPSSGGWTATTTGTQNSSALISMVQADGLLIVPEGITQVEAGAVLAVHLLRPLPDAVSEKDEDA